MPRVRSPKRGSRAFSPRKRAKNINGRIDFWPETSGDPQLLGFAGYKAGMTHVFAIEDRARSPDYGREMKRAVTVVDTPPMNIVGIRAYVKTYDGLKVLTEAWVKDIPIDILRTIKVFGGEGPEFGLKKMEDKIEKIIQLRVIAATQPKLSSVSKKKPDIMEIPVGGGSVEEQFSYAKGLLGKTINISDIFNSGESIDVIGVTKGKGFQGPVKRWGVRILQHKSRKTKRGVASIGPWVPRRIMHGVPRAGQMGFHGRTEYNKRIYQLGSEGTVTPKGGFKQYGVVKGDYAMLKGSVQGPAKRLIKFRKAARHTSVPSESPKITYVHAEFKKQMEDN